MGEPLRAIQGTGEVRSLEALEDELGRQQAIIAGLERDIRGWAVRYRQLAEDRNQLAREHPCWEAGEWLFNQWRRACKHPRARWTPDRFWLIEPFLVNDKWGKTLRARLAMCRLAIDGAAFDAFRRQRRNGTWEVFDEWERIFASAGKLESFCKKAPEDAVERCRIARHS